MTTENATHILTPRQRINRIAVAVSVFMTPAWSLSFAESDRGFSLFAVLTVAILVVLGTLDRTSVDVIKGRVAPVLLYLAVAAFGGIAFIFHPSTAGAILTFGMVTVVGVLVAVSSFTKPELRSFVAIPFLAMSAVQAFIVMIQSATDTAFGYALLHPGASLLITEGYARPQGMFDHVYEAAIVAILAIAIGLALLPKAGHHRWTFLIGIGLAAISLALTHSRSAFLGLVLVVAIGAVAAVRSIPSLRLGVAIVIVAFGVPALMTASIWEARLTESVTGSLDEASSGRITLMAQAVDLAASHPIVGVGPNRYIEVLETRVDESEVTFVVHNIPLMVTAELGIPAGLLAAVLLIWAGVQSIAGGFRTALLFAAPMPFFLFDVIMYNRPFGLLLFAIWCGVLGGLLRQSVRVEPTEVSHAHRS